MVGEDQNTLRFYSEEAEAYANRNDDRSYEHLDLFLARLTPGCSILELGCGGGDDSAYMLARGFDVTPTDGSPELAYQAQKRLGVPAEVLKFDQIVYRNKFDAVWANACLLHIPRSDLKTVLKRIERSLKIDGLFYASYKAGKQEGRDKFGRYYNYPTVAWLKQTYGPTWRSLEINTVMGSGYDNEPTEWLHVVATKSL
ncbi:methyltransferase family protein [Phyllobacterium sp. YR531]|nr:class I SAM-dependent methyltransferase [Phyllobacterium sp. YR531]EJN04016.1 methyltransferase family protein [Phyllobacterium sp. YR531]